MPILNELGEKINKIAFALEKNQSLIGRCNKSGVSIGVLINELRAISKDTNRHSSIDTIARKYYLQGDMDSYQKIKSLINFIFCYMELEQREFAIDKRYDSFFATVLNTKLELPQNCLLLSWNYDIQVERAYAQYKKTGNLSEARVHINYRSGDFVANRHDISKDSFMYKLNGTCGYLKSKNLHDNPAHGHVPTVGAFHSCLVPFTNLQHRTAREARYSIPQGYISYRATLAFCQRTTPTQVKRAVFVNRSI